MKFELMCIGRTRDDLMRELTERYRERTSRYVPFEIRVLPDVKGAGKLPAERQKQLEGEQILGALAPGDTIILLDERGKQFSSREFAEMQQRHMVSGVKRVVYVVGGPYGFSAEVYARANGKISLSKMTFSHEMVRLFFCEQMYRAMTILRGEPYHHD